MAKTVLFVADSDSNVKFATSFSKHIEEAGLSPKVVFVGSKLSLLTQAASFAQDGVRVEVAPSFEQLFASREVLRYDVIFVLITGKLIRNFCSNLNLLALTYGVPKPVTIGGFIGEWISASGQVEERGALDIFVVNRADELEKFRDICGRASYGKIFKALPYAFLVRHSFAKPLAPTFEYDTTKTIVFADQVQVPRSDGERSFLYENLEAIAHNAPGLKIYYCAREAIGGATNHRSLGGITDYLGVDRLASLPNLRIEHGTFQHRLAEADVVVSVSSTAGVEALINGVPALFLRGFASSGAEKFAHTGLLIDLYELKAPKTFTIDPHFYDEISRLDVWDDFVELVRSQPSRGIDAYPRKRAVRTSLLAAPGPVAQYEELVYDVFGFYDVEELTVTLNTLPLELQAVAGGHGAATGYASTVVLSATPRVAPLRASPAIVATKFDDLSVTAELSFTGTEFSSHLPFLMESGDYLEMKGHIGKEALKISCQKNNSEVVCHDSSEIQCKRSAYKIGAQGITVFRIRAFANFTLESARIVRDSGSVMPTWVAYEPYYYNKRLGVLSPTLKSGSSAISAHGKSGQVTVFEFERELFGQAESLFSFKSTQGGEITVESSSGSTLSITMKNDDSSIRKDVVTSTLSVRMIVISTSTMTMVTVNENLLVFEAPFIPTALMIEPQARGGLGATLFAAFGAEVTLTKANTLLEQLLLRFYSAPSFAKKHREIPDFRPAVEARLGKPLAPTKSEGSKTPPSTKPDGKLLAAPVSTNKRIESPASPKEKSPAAPALKVAKASNAAVSGRAVVSPTPKPKAELIPPDAKLSALPDMAVQSTAKMSPAISRYIDLVTANDLSLAIGVAEAHTSPLAFSQRFMREKQFGRALALSAIAVDRTPASKAHLLICAEALSELGAPDRAEAFLRKAEALAPNDRAIKAKAALIRAKQSGAATSTHGVASIFSSDLHSESPARKPAKTVGAFIINEGALKPSLKNAATPVKPDAKRPAISNGTTYSTPDISAILSKYADLVAAADLSLAAEIADVHPSPLALSERFLREQQYGKALALSAIASDRTPTSKAHLLICAEALSELGAPDRAEAFLRKAEALGPDDSRMKSKAALIRVKQSGAATAADGVAGLFRRALGGR